MKIKTYKYIAKLIVLSATMEWKRIEYCSGFNSVLMIKDWGVH